MFRTALRNVLAHKARLLMTVLAVMLGVAFVSGTLVFTNTISDAYQKSSAKGFDRVDVAVQPKFQDSRGDKVGKLSDLTRATLDKAAKVPGAASATGVVSGFTAVAGKDGSLALFDTPTAQQLFGKKGIFDEIDVKAAAGTSQTALKAELDKALPAHLVETTTGKQLADDQAKQIADSMSGLKQALLVFAGIALFVGTFIIANTFTMLVAQRTRELALLRAVGASRRQVTRVVLGEAVVVGAVGGLVGMGVGLALARGLQAAVALVGLKISGGLPVH